MAIRKKKLKKYYYFYRITNTINGKYYYGVHSTDNLDDGYMGSGFNLKKAYDKYGIQNFRKEILKYFDTFEEAYRYEGDIVNESEISNENCYNIAHGGYGICEGLVVVEDKDGNRTSVSINDERYLSGELKSPFIGRVLCKDSTGKAFIVNKDDKRYKSGELVPFCTGRKLTNEHKQKLREAQLKCTESRFIHKGEYIKRVNINEVEIYVNEGWELGKGFGLHTYVNKDGKYITIPKSKLSEYIQNGWSYGTGCKNVRKLDLNSEDIIQDIRNGLRKPEIAKKYNVSVSTLGRFLHKEHINLRSKTGY